MQWWGLPLPLVIALAPIEQSFRADIVQKRALGMSQVPGSSEEVFLMVPPSSHEGAAKALAEELQELGERGQRGPPPQRKSHEAP